jgi:hypothetical protein
VNYTMTPAAQVAVDVLLLLRRGRVGPALAQLERLPALVRAEVDAAYDRGRLDLAREITHGKPERQPAPKRHEWLRGRIADPELRARARATLRLDDTLLDRVAAGTVQLSPDSWRKLRRELGG